MRSQTLASFVVNGYVDNSIFDLAHQSNRDHSFYPFYLVRQKLIEYGYELNTVDLTHGKQVGFTLHMNVQDWINTEKNYLLLLESPQVYPANGVASNLKRYRKIFTWNDQLVNSECFVKINFPNLISVYDPDGFENRSRFCCMIAGNKTLRINDNRNLYPERVKTIRWFEKHAPQDFDLYGVDWDIFPLSYNGFLGQVEKRIFRAQSKFFKLSPFPSYRGRIEKKGEILVRTRFSICFENVRDLPGYITEKIFDSFCSGCVPVYWGANNITSYIPSDCFIDRRQFRNTSDLYEFLKAMSEHEYIGYQQRIQKFLLSAQSYPFSAECFCDTVVKSILQDL